MDDLRQRLANLSPAKRGILELQLERNRARAGLAESIPRRAADDPVPASYAQQRLWFLNQLETDNAFYNVPIARRLRGRLDIDALRKAVERLTIRHEALRTNFVARDGRPLQVISETPRFAFSVIDLRHLKYTALDSEVDRLARAEADLPFDLSADPLLRVKLLLREEEDFVLLITMHHIVSDGWSMEVLVRELAALYEEFTTGTPAELRELPIQYADYSVWQREWLESETIEKQLSYWRNQLHGIPSLLELPRDRPRPPVQSYRGRLLTFVVPSDLAQQLNEFSRKEAVTLFTTLLAAFQTLLWRYTGQNDIVVGTPVANRNRPEIEGLIGFFVNTLVIRSKLSANLTFREFLGKVREVVLNALANQDLPFEKLVDDLQPERSLSLTPLFQVNFTLQKMRPPFAFNGIAVERLPFERTTSKFDLLLTALERPEHLALTVEYNTEIFDDSRMDRMLGHYQRLLESIVADPEVRISQLPILTDRERDQLLIDWNQTSATFSDDKCIHELFEAEVERLPNSVAVVFEQTQLTYRELDQRANGLARMLSKLGVGAESVVGLCVKRSTEMVIGLLGILKAGGAYLPLDPGHPKDLLSYMLIDAGASVLLTEESLRAKFSAEAPDLICLDHGWSTIDEESSFEVQNKVKPQNLAYVIYTSGSTGKPKGVMITHRGVVNYLNWSTNAYRVADGSGSLLHSPLGFDLTVTSLWAPLVSGGRVTLLREEDGIEELGLALSTGMVHGLVKLTPSHLEGLSHLLRGKPMDKTRTLVVGGEALFGERLSFLRMAAPETKIINEYGPTETVVGCCVYEVGEDHSSGPVPIGRPIANTTLYVLDDHLEPVPVGVPGELYIGGAGVARGYVNRASLTAEKFIPDPFSRTPGQRLYRSEDVVRYLGDGNLEYIGRRDKQLKLRGYRIELGELEAILNSHELVREAVVLGREDEPGNKQLVAYVVPDLDASPTEHTRALEAAQVSGWQEVFEESYGRAQQPSNPTFNIAGWNSSYTGEPIPDHEMGEWVERTVERIRALKPKRVLEIGCGTGLLLFRLAPHCESYHGTDFSQAALDYVGEQLAGLGPEFANVTLSRQQGNDLELEAGAFDTIILNSVVQYFPSAEYLVNLLREAIRILKPSGSIFLGDLRSTRLQRALYASVELHNASEQMPVSELRRKIEKRMAREQELVIDPSFFKDLRQQLPQLCAAEIHLKRGRYANELSKFRYDVILRVGEVRPARQVQGGALNWREDGLSLEVLKRRLADNQPEILVTKEVPNALLTSEFNALELLDSHPGPQTSGELREALRTVDVDPGVHPEELWAFAGELPYRVHLSPSAPPHYCAFDVVFTRQDRTHEGLPELEPEEEAQHCSYTNNPLRARMEQSLLHSLRKLFKEKLPDYMAPSEYVFLTAWPLTSNGKIDRSALPPPDQSHSDLRAFRGPGNEIEKQLAGIWSEILRRKEVGIDDNFFQIGGHSLLATQVISRIRERFNIQFPLRRLFEFPTIAELANAVGQAQREGKASPALQIRTKRRDGSRLLKSIDSLSAEEIDSLLGKVLRK